MKKIYFSILFTIFVLCLPLSAQIGIWTSTSELANVQMSGIAWDKLKSAADNNFYPPVLSDNNSNTDVHCLAAAIVYARTDDENYKNRVISALERLVADGKPENNTLRWARNTGSYALAADLIGYRTAAFENWLTNMAEVYEDNHPETILEMFKRRPNNWGTQAFGCLCAIYRYLENSARLSEIRDYWIQEVTGPKPAGLDYDSDVSWHVNTNNLRLINPKGALKQGLNIDGVIPDDMRRNGSFSNPPPKPSTSYHWETLQGIIMGARILERAGMPIWDVADSAIYRAGYILQVRWENDFSGWKAEGDDLWMLPFFDNAYGTSWSEGQPDRMWEHGKNTGWPYVLLGETGIRAEKNGLPRIYQLYQNSPNPFNSETKIIYFLPQSCHVNLTVYDTAGRTVSTLVNKFQTSGMYYKVWDAVDSSGMEVPSGVYFCCIKIENYLHTIKMILMR